MNIKQNTHKIFCLFSLLIYLNHNAYLQAQCNNVNFESCNFTGWSGTHSKNNNTARAPLPDRFFGLFLGTNNQVSNQTPERSHFIMNNGYDPFAGNNIPVVNPNGGGTCTARLGNAQGNGGGETISRKWTVTAGQNAFTYNYAVVLDNAGGHNANESPYFRIRMWYFTSAIDSVLINCATLNVDASTAGGIGGFVNAGSGRIYKPWSSVTIPLDDYIGMDVRITFETRDCNPTCNTSQGEGCGSHFAYVYLDCSCDPIEIIPSEESTCDGHQTSLTAPAGAASYQWQGPSIVSGANTRTVTIDGPGTYSVNMTAFGQAACVYTRTINVPPRTLTAIPSFSATAVCMGTTTSFTDLSTGTITTDATWTWDFGDNTAESNLRNPTHTYAAAGTYSVNLTLVSPCVRDTTINVQVLSFPTATFTTQTVCINQGSTISYTGSAPSGSTFTWNFNGGTVISGTGQGPYQVSWPTAGTKNVSLSVNSGGCVTSNTVATTINPIPTVTVTSTSICEGLSTTVTASGASSYSWSTGGTGASLTASPAATTSYTVTGTTSGCSAYAIATINIINAPVVVVTPDTICVGSTATLTAEGATSYSWSTGGTGSELTVSPTTSTTYTVVGEGCENLSTGRVTVNPLPVINTSAATICYGFTATITATGGSSYVWNNSKTTASISESPANTATYTVTGTSAAGCSSYTTTTIRVNQLPDVSSSSATICSGATATITASGASSYIWHNNKSTASISESPSNTTSYSVTGSSAQGCKSTATGTITVNPLPPTMASSATICLGATATITATGANTYLWNNGQTSESIAESPTSSTTYSITGTSAVGCIFETTARITVNPLPPVASTSSTVCIGATATITATGASSYLWSNGKTTASISENPTSTTAYSVTGTSAVGCVSTATANIIVNPLPEVGASSATICRGNFATIYATGASSYVWNNGKTTYAVTENPNNTSTYSVTGTSSVGCKSSATGTITVNSIPDVTVTSDTICNGESSTISASGADTYIWNNGKTSDVVSENPNNTRSYTVRGYSAEGCSSSATATITVNALPVIQVSSATICYGESATITTSGADTYVWNNNKNTASITENPAATTYYVVEGTSTEGCKSSGGGRILVNPLPNISVNSKSICPGESATLMANGASRYVWSTRSEANFITMSPKENTNYTVRGWSLYNCTNEASGSIVIYNKPVAAFMANPAETSIFNPEIEFKNKSSDDVIYWNWDFGDNNNTDSNVENPVHRYPEVANSYSITLIVYNKHKCLDTTESVVKINPEYAFYIPNSFTPNSDSRNEGFRGRGIGIKEYRLEIFDRWGNYIWHSTVLDEYWDGKVKGGKHDLVQQDVFVWKVYIIDIFDEPHNYVGTVTIVK